MRVCKESGCGKKHYARDLCRDHYHKLPEHVEYRKRWRKSEVGKASMRAADRRARGIPDPTRPCPDKCENQGCEVSAKLVPDHNHETGKFRGWICGSCNRAAGLLKSDATLKVMRGLLLYHQKNDSVHILTVSED